MEAVVLQLKNNLGNLQAIVNCLILSISFPLESLLEKLSSQGSEFDSKFLDAHL